MYIFFECLKCGAYNAWQEKTADGHSCCQCGGNLKPIGKGSLEEYRKCFDYSMRYPPGKIKRILIFGALLGWVLAF